MEKTNTIGRDFTTRELILFAASPVLTHFSSALLQTLDDGLFLSRYVGPNALAAFTITMPLFMLMGAVADMFLGVGVLCATLMGEKKGDEARRNFTTVAIAMVVFSVMVSMLMAANMDSLIRLLGATDILFPYVKGFYSIAVYYIPLNMINALFSRFYVTAGKPHYSMITMGISTFCNFFFDYLFIVRLQFGMAGAAYANLLANITLFVFGIIFYTGKNCEIGFGKLNPDVRPLLRKCFMFGLPQAMTSIALSVNSFIANQILLETGGEMSVSAFAIVNNIQFIFKNGLFGFSGAVCPIVSYAYGERNREKIDKTIKQIITITTMLTIVIIFLYITCRNILLSLYLKDNAVSEVRSLALYGLTVSPLAYLFFDYNVLAIDLFVALNDNRTSTALTFLENVIFANMTMILLPKLFGLTGVWFAFTAGEILTFIFTIYFFLKKRNITFPEEA